ncbi:MAG: M20/M25/M40 family metallo-hydrolase [Microthrixaceae bacterium]
MSEHPPSSHRPGDLDRATLTVTVADVWNRLAVPAIETHIAVPALSPAFDGSWAQAGHLDTVLTAASDWLEALDVPGLTVSRRDLPGRTPLLLVEVPPTAGATNTGVVLAYGHLDKQPEMTGWDDDLAPWTPVRKGDRLYGRGGADDGYSVYALGTALVALAHAGGEHGRIVGVIECSEESGSPDLPAHLAALGDELGTPDLVVCLDSGCGDYERLWVTTSLRGLVSVDLRVDVLGEGVHSGAAGGIVPSSFRIARGLIDRIENSDDGRLLIDELRTSIPDERRRQATETAETLGRPPAFPWAGDAHPTNPDVAGQLLDRTWGPSLEVIGADGLPPLADAGNVARPFTTLGLSIRIPPGVDPEAATHALRAELEADPPHGATVTVSPGWGAEGWDAPPTAPWLADALTAASGAWFDAEPRWIGEGGTIPFMAMLGRQFPDAQFVVTGVLGPGSNAHGPNEFLDVAFAERLTGCIADVLHAHANRPPAASN